jgi:hypothetical protein
MMVVDADFTNTLTTGTLILFMAIAGLAIQVRRYQRSVQAENYRALEKKNERLESDIREREARITQLSTELRSEQSRPTVDHLAEILTNHGKLMNEGFVAMRQQTAQVAERLAQSEERSAQIHAAMLKELKIIANHNGGSKR